MISNFKFHISEKGNKSRCRASLLLGTFSFFLLTSPFAFANTIGNPSFEEPIGNGTGGNWDNTNGAIRATPGDANYPVASVLPAPNDHFNQVPPQGTHLLILPGNVGRFTFQTKDGVSEGDYVVFSGYAQTDSIGDANLKIEFKKINPDGSDTLISSVSLDAAQKISAGTAPPGALGADNPFVFFSTAGIAPEGTQRIVFVIETDGLGGAGSKLLIDQMNGEINPAKLTLAVSKRNVSPGDAVGVNAHFRNASGNSYQSVKMRINIPQGFDYAQKSVRVNGRQASYQKGSILVDVGSMAPSEEITVSFVALVTSGVQIGKQYSLEAVLSGDAVAPDPLGGPDVLYPGQLSQKASVKLTTQNDPVFEQGTIIGKVFNDLNQNTVQDCGEEGVPWVRLYTEEGIGIVTDENGLYHVPAVNPGRHVVKIDGHSLPEGTKFITEEAYLVKTTPGIMNKANFAVLLPPSGIPDNFKKDLSVMVTQGVDVSRPTLDIRITPDVLKLGVGVLEKEPVFTFDNNYGKFIKKWTVEVRDELGRPVWVGYGIGQPPPEVTWTGIAESGLLITPGIYSYQLKVRDSKNREDWTALKFFEVMTKLSPKGNKNYHPEIPPVGDFNLFKDGKRSIPLIAKPTVRVQGKTKPENQIKINETPVSVDGESGMFQKEFFVEPGEYDVRISATTPEGETTSFNKKITVKDSTFFMVALGEEQLGQNWASGALEAADSNAYRDGFTEEGRAAFYLKGKLKGKFLVKAHYDTASEGNALFTNLNPNDYYPIYGDGSTRDYDAHDTAQKLYILVEMDKSYLKWGSFKTEFTDTELATYNRTLSGLKVNFDTVASTVYGDPQRGFKVFAADSTSQADHNELYATGGSLFYTRNRNMIEGSEKIRVEIRDKIQNMTVASYDLQEGLDYEIDYPEGRILLSRPLSSVAATDTLTSTDILDGSPVYLIVDYEYDPGTDTKIPNRGIRGYTWVGDHLRIGATAVEEKRSGGDYDMRGVDAMMKFGRNTKITAEYATTINQQMGTSVSYDGGISYADLGSLSRENTKPVNGAYLIRASSEPVKGLQTTGYLQGLQPPFSNGYMRSQEGLQKYGIETRYKINDDLAVRYRYDHSGVVGELEPLNQEGIETPYKDLGVHTAQVVYDDGQYLAELEYQRRNPSSSKDTVDFVPTIMNQIPFNNGVTGKVGYHINERLLPYVKVQTAFGGKNDHQFGGGVRYEVMNNLFAYLEEMIGPLGDSTYFGFERQHGNGARTYANLRSFDRGIGEKTLATAIGNSFALSEKSRMYSEREYSSYQGQDSFADILGYEGKVGDHWDYGGKFERRRLSNSSVQLLNASAAEALAANTASNIVGGNLAYADGKKLRARTYWEYRYDQHDPKLGQIVTRNSLSYQLNEDVSFLTNFNYGDARQYDPGNNPATFMEFTTGFAIRPIKLDKFNMLARYTYLKDLGADQQYDNGYYDGFQSDQTAHILATDFAYDLNRYFGFVEKLAFKRSTLRTSASDIVSVNTFLSANRVNFHVTRKWDLALEYRILMQSSSLDTLKSGALVEIDREFYEYVRLGVGYNFTDFSDDLRNANNFKTNGPFVRMTGKF